MQNIYQLLFFQLNTFLVTIAFIAVQNTKMVSFSQYILIIYTLLATIKNTKETLSADTCMRIT